MRELSPSGYLGVIQRITSEIFLALLTIKITRLDEFGAEVDDIYRVVSGTDQDVTSNGNTFTPYPFEIILPEDSIESVEQATLTIDNVDRLFVDALRSATAPIVVTVQIALESQPDVIEVELTEMDGREVTWNANNISATLTLIDTWNQKFPGVGETYDPQQCPGLF